MDKGNYISLPKFSFFNPPIENTIPVMEMTLKEVFELISKDKLKRKTELMRRLPEEDFKRYKSTKLNFCTFSGLFVNRKDEDLRAHSGYAVFDLDHLNNIEETRYKLINDNILNIHMLFTSPSGKGLKAVIYSEKFKVNHKSLYKEISFYLEKKHGLRADDTSDVSRACFLCWDPNIYINGIYGCSGGYDCPF